MLKTIQFTINMPNYHKSFSDKLAKELKTSQIQHLKPNIELSKEGYFTLERHRRDLWQLWKNAIEDAAEISRQAQESLLKKIPRDIQLENFEQDFINLSYENVDSKYQIKSCIKKFGEKLSQIRQTYNSWGENPLLNLKTWLLRLWKTLEESCLTYMRTLRNLSTNCMSKSWAKKRLAPLTFIPKTTELCSPREKFTAWRQSKLLRPSRDSVKTIREISWINTHFEFWQSLISISIVWWIWR